MPYANHRGVRLYWEEHGAGEPVLMIMGLSYTLDMWYRLLPAVSARYRAIVFDNRGVGKSDSPSGRYSMRAMAGDALTVLRAAGVRQAHLLGASMGGMIAQELALRHPEAVRSLMLGCTSHGGIRAKWPQFGCLPREVYRWERLDEERRERSLIPMLYAPTTPLSRIEEDIAIRLRSGRPLPGLFGQIAAILPWSSYFRLPRIHQPTCVVHGEQDRLIPIENGRVVAARIRGAKFHTVPNAGHMLTTDQPEAVTALALDFLDTVTLAQESRHAPALNAWHPPQTCG